MENSFNVCVVSLLPKSVYGLRVKKTDFLKPIHTNSHEIYELPNDMILQKLREISFIFCLCCKRKKEMSLPKDIQQYIARDMLWELHGLFKREEFEKRLAKEEPENLLLCVNVCSGTFAIDEPVIRRLISSESRRKTVLCFCGVDEYLARGGDGENFHHCCDTMIQVINAAAEREVFDISTNVFFCGSINKWNMDLDMFAQVMYICICVPRNNFSFLSNMLQNSALIIKK